ncbi:MAG: phosphoribosylglycinamide formyltransferase [Candidatus Saganbacteria bacterium]|uniref:Phosphoribosylglycinamide formyltransferase n=1 Tax=Candidatus Saganbacteria bacterium TaxID=2575572 RepID=A0A833L083_UNCSA|nr:MAG: phosphoribosylglycinamide formyltransferase [Candidatus Saganbacteria bacterium]
MTNLGVLISGRGSNLEALINASNKKEIPAKIAVVISDKSDAFGLERARKHNIEAVYINPDDFKGKDAYEQGIVKTLKKHNVNLVCLAGYMRIAGKVLIDSYKSKIINIHPSLLPAFPGLNAQKQALEHGVKISGATVHFVDEGCDTGPIIVQSAVPVLAGDTIEILSSRILAEEHKLYPLAVKYFAEGKLKIEGRRVIIQ